MVIEMSALGRVIDFLSSQPTDESILQLKATTAEEERVDHLAALNNEGLISKDEEHELHNCLLAQYVMGIAKAKAFGRLNTGKN